MFHYLYQIQFASGHYYSGKRSCETAPENDVYFGSGVDLRYFIKQGIEFTKTIVSTHDSSQEAFVAEKDLIGESWKMDSWNKSGGLCLNRMPGGKGAAPGSDHHFFGKAPMLGKTHSEESKLKTSQSRKGQKPSLETRSAMSRAHAGKPVPDFTGRKHSEATKEKQRIAMLTRLNRSRNVCPAEKVNS